MQLLVALIRGPASGGWAAVRVEQWRSRLQGSAVLAARGLEVIELTHANGELRGAILRHDLGDRAYPGRPVSAGAARGTFSALDVGGVSAGADSGS